MKRGTGRTAKKVEPILEGRKRLLSEERVRDWYDDKANKSKLSAVTNVRKLDFLLEQLGLSLDEIEEMARKNPEELRRRLNRYASKAKAAGRLDSYIGKVFIGLRAYFKFRGIPFTLFPELDSIQGASIATERVPTQEQLAVVLDRLSTRGRVIALLIAHSGVRPQVVGAYEGARGLVLSDLPDLVLDPEPRFEQVPFTILGRAELAKRRKMWTTFGSRQLASAVVAYLRERKERGERFEPNSPLVTHNEVRGAALRSRERSGTRFMTTTRVVLEVANALHATAPKGTRWRPYVLRGYFSTALLRAGVDRELREALMSHGGDKIAAAYNVGKPWSDDLLEKARAEYDRASEYLETFSHPKVDVKNESLRTLLEAVEKAKGEKADGSLTDLTKAIHSLLRNESPPPALEAGAVPIAPIRPVLGKRVGEQKVISAEATEAYLAIGWTFKSELNGTKAVVEWPGNLS